MRLDVGEPVSSHSGGYTRARCGSPSFPRYPHMPLPCSRLPVRPPPTWPAPHCGGVLLCAWRCCPPLRKQEGPDEMKYFGIQSHGFGTCSIRFVRSLRSRYAMFASEWLPAFLGWECFTHWVSITCFIFLSLDSSCSGCWRDSLPSVSWFGLEFGCGSAAPGDSREKSRPVPPLTPRASGSGAAPATAASPSQRRNRDTTPSRTKSRRPPAAA